VTLTQEMILWEDGVEHLIDARTGAHRGADHGGPVDARRPGDATAQPARTAGVTPASTLGDR
jgi:hypothetical protein